MKKNLWKPLAAGMLAAILAVTPVCAEDQVDLQAVYEISTNDIPNWPQGPEISSDTGILMDADTGVVLYEKGADELRYPASITKLLTLLVAVENSSLDDEVVFTETCLRDVSSDSANIGMVAGEVTTMEECLYAMILASANEVSTQIAEFVGGTEENFISMMNERAQELGCVNTRFINANGLPGEGQYTTARDMALIFQACLQNKTARKIIKTKSHTMPATNMNASERQFSTHHPMVYQDMPEYYYEGCLGGKTGNTNDAGSTLVSWAKRDDRTYITVVLRADGLPQSCFDTAALFDYAFDDFKKISEEGDASVTVPSGSSLSDLETEDVQEDGQTVRSYYFQGRYMGSSVLSEVLEEPVEEISGADEEPLYQTGNTDEAEASAQEENADASFGQENVPGVSDLTLRLLAVMGAMAALLAVLLAALLLKKRKAKKKRKRKK